MRINLFYVISAIIMFAMAWGLFVFVSPKKSNPAISNTPLVQTASVPTPSGLMSSNVSDTSVTISWNPATNPEGVVGYRIYRNDQVISTTSTPAFISTNLTPSTTYNFAVAAFDKLGNISAMSSSILITTQAGKTAVNSPPAHTPTPTPTKTPGGQPTPTPTAKPTSTCGSGGVCTAADIAPHNSRGNCWVYLSPVNKAYNITAYVANGGSAHPGGDVIVPLCGKNMYDYFMGTAGGHKHTNYALNTILEAYYIGPFQ